MVAAGEACSSDRLQVWEHQNLVVEGHLHDGSCLSPHSPGLEYQKVVAGESWCQMVVAGEGWCQMVVVVVGWYQMVVVVGCYRSVGSHLVG